jgi:hypothetical protein
MSVAKKNSVSYLRQSSFQVHSAIYRHKTQQQNWALYFCLFNDTVSNAEQTTAQLPFRNDRWKWP